MSEQIPIGNETIRRAATKFAGAHWDDVAVYLDQPPIDNNAINGVEGEIVEILRPSWERLSGDGRGDVYSFIDDLAGRTVSFCRVEAAQPDGYVDTEEELNAARECVQRLWSGDQKREYRVLQAYPPPADGGAASHTAPISLKEYIWFHVEVELREGSAAYERGRAAGRGEVPPPETRVEIPPPPPEHPYVKIEVEWNHQLLDRDIVWGGGQLAGQYVWGNGFGVGGGLILSRHMLFLGPEWSWNHRFWNDGPFNHVSVKGGLGYFQAWDRQELVGGPPAGEGDNAGAALNLQAALRLFEIPFDKRGDDRMGFELTSGVLRGLAGGSDSLGVWFPFAGLGVSFESGM